jgi:hypothetical protein
MILTVAIGTSHDRLRCSGVDRDIDEPGSERRCIMRLGLAAEKQQIVDYALRWRNIAGVSDSAVARTTLARRAA